MDIWIPKKKKIQSKKSNIDSSANVYVIIWWLKTFFFFSNMKNIWNVVRIFDNLIINFKNFIKRHQCTKTVNTTVSLMIMNQPKYLCLHYALKKKISKKVFMCFHETTDLHQHIFVVKYLVIQSVFSCSGTGLFPVCSACASMTSMQLIRNLIDKYRSTDILVIESLIWNSNIRKWSETL